MDGKTVLKWAAGIGTGLGITYLIRKGGNLNTASQLIFDLTKVDIKGFDKLNAYLRISNPTPGTSTFDSVNTEIYFNKINIGRIYYNKAVLIAANTSQVFMFPVIMYPSGVLEIAKNVLETRAKTGVFKIDGSAYVNGIKVPISKEIKSW